MIDKERKREADRTRRALIRAGAWDFPQGGSPDLAKATSAAILNSAGKPSVFTPAPSSAPRRAAPLSAPRHAAPSPMPRYTAPPPSRALTVIVPPLTSMVADGGRPGRGLVPQGRGYPAPPDIAAVSPFTRAEEFQAKTVKMFAAQAAEIDALRRDVASLKASEAERNRAADWHDLSVAFMGVFRYITTGR